MALTGGHLSKEEDNDDNTQDLGITSQWVLRNRHMKILFIDMKFPILKTAPGNHAAQVMWKFKEVTMESLLEVGMCIEIMEFLFQRMHEDFQYVKKGWCCKWMNVMKITFSKAVQSALLVKART